MVTSRPDAASRLAASTMARRVRCFWLTRPRPRDGTQGSLIPCMLATSLSLVKSTILMRVYLHKEHRRPTLIRESSLLQTRSLTMPDATPAVPTTSTTYTVPVDGIGPVPVTVTERGQGRPYLLLHGGAGPQSVDSFAALLAGSTGARVLTPLHPGFGGTPRPDALATMGGLAQLYTGLLDHLDLTGVTVIGNSIGGWIAAEIALLNSPR